jgi:hypothetical protein
MDGLSPHPLYRRILISPILTWRRKTMGQESQEKARMLLQLARIFALLQQRYAGCCLLTARTQRVSTRTSVVGDEEKF